jgi:hypothetical protein
LDFAVCDRVGDVGPALVHLQDQFGFVAVFPEESVRAPGGLDPEPEFGEAARRF